MTYQRSPKTAAPAKGPKQGKAPATAGEVVQRHINKTAHRSQRVLHGGAQRSSPDVRQAAQRFDGGCVAGGVGMKPGAVATGRGKRT